MGKESKIQWTDATWNIARGCSKVDEDCKYCYMYRESLNNSRYNPKQVVMTKTVFNFPLKYKETKSKAWGGRPLIFTSSLTDVFHPEIDSFRNEMWDIIRQCPHLIFQILTKRPERITDHLPEYWPEISERVWLGTSIGSQKSIHRLADLISSIQPGIKFLSLEPLHSPITLPLDDFVDMGHKVKDLIDWIIVGGESGNENGKYRYRPCQKEWINTLVVDAWKAGIPVFVKQLGTHLAKEMGLKDRSGSNIDEWPVKESYKGAVRQFPEIFEPEIL